MNGGSVTEKELFRIWAEYRLGRSWVAHVAIWTVAILAIYALIKCVLLGYSAWSTVQDLLTPLGWTLVGAEAITTGLLKFCAYALWLLLVNLGYQDDRRQAKHLIDDMTTCKVNLCGRLISHIKENPERKVRNAWRFKLCMLPKACIEPIAIVIVATLLWWYSLRYAGTIIGVASYITAYSPAVLFFLIMLLALRAIYFHRFLTELRLATEAAASQ